MRTKIHTYVRTYQEFNKFISLFLLFLLLFLFLSYLFANSNNKRNNSRLSFYLLIIELAENYDDTQIHSHTYICMRIIIWIGVMNVHCSERSFFLLWLRVMIMNIVAIFGYIEARDKWNSIIKIRILIKYLFIVLKSVHVIIEIVIGKIKQQQARITYAVQKKKNKCLSPSSNATR